MGHTAAGDAHGVLMVVAWIFLTEITEVIGLWASCKTRRWTNYFKVIENGESLWNVHRALNVAAFLISIVAMIIALSTKEFAKATSDEDEDKDGAERHIVYAFALMAAALIQVVGAVTLHDKFPLAKSVHKWFGRAMNLYAFLVAWTGYELGLAGTNDTAKHEAGSRATKDGNTGSQMIMAMFVIWALVKVCIIGYYWALRCMGKAQEYPEEKDAKQVEMPDKGVVATA